MPFSVKFIGKPEVIEDEISCWGRIRIGQFSERFITGLVFWSMEDFRRQWQEGIRRTLEGAARSCLMVSMYTPLMASFVESWILYREGETVYIQNQLWRLKYLKPFFDPQNPYRHISGRETVNDEGRKISEWSIGLEEIRKFYQSFKEKK